MELEPVSGGAQQFGFPDFLTGLFSEGKARVSEGPAPTLDPATSECLILAEIASRSELPGPPPPFSLDVARWATIVLYHACQFVICRDFGEDVMVAALKNPCPAERGPSTDWSADLLFQHLPEVFRQARHLSRNDPLVREVEYLGATWPLSSVGIPNLGGLDLGTFWPHPTLAKLYVDRVLRTADVSRLGDHLVDDRIRVAIGGHPELCPVIAKSLGIESA